MTEPLSPIRALKRLYNAAEMGVVDQDYDDAMDDAALTINREEKPLPIETAPKDGRMLRLLVDYSDDESAHALEDARIAWTIGFNNLDQNEIDEWQFAGWDWSHDRFTQGFGKPIGWLPLDWGDPNADIAQQAEGREGEGE